MRELPHIYRHKKLTNISQRRYKRKYNPEYLEKKVSQGASIKLGFGDFDGDGDLDGLYPKQRAGVAEKPGLHINEPRRGPNMLSAFGLPAFGPTNLRVPTPEAGPLSLEFLTAPPQFGPTGLSTGIQISSTGPAMLNASVVIPEAGPSSLNSAVVAPQLGPSSLETEDLAPDVGPSSLSSTILVPEVGPTNLSSTIFVPVYDDQELIISGLTGAQNEDITKHRTPLGLGTFLYPYTGGMPGAPYTVRNSSKPDYIVDQHDLWLASQGQQGKYWRHITYYSDVHTIYRISNKDGIITYGLREYDKYRPGVPTDTDENIDHWYTAEYVASTFFAIEPKLFTESMLTQTSDP